MAPYLDVNFSECGMEQSMEQSLVLGAAAGALARAGAW
jgi:hypothetical protein